MALRRNILRKSYYFAPPVLWMAFIFSLSSHQRVSFTHTYVSDFMIFKTLHMIEYAVLFFLLFRAAYSLRKAVFPSTVFGIVCGILFAASDEIHQLFTPTREGTIRDILIDTVGIIIMAVAVGRYLKKLKAFL